MLPLDITTADNQNYDRVGAESASAERSEDKKRGGSDEQSAGNESEEEGQGIGGTGIQPTEVDDFVSQPASADPGELDADEEK